jgi:heme/copper-type cytochrome/quinol oxidase subunit 3
MIQQKTLDVSHLEPYAISSQAPLWWGQACIVAIEATMFCILIAAYFYVRLRMDVWPPPGDQFPHLLLPTLALIPLIGSAFASYWASESAKKNDQFGALWGLLLNLLLAGVAFVMRLIEWHSLNFNWKADAQGSYVWAFLGLHSFDYIGDLVFTLVLAVIVVSGRFGEKVRLGVHVDSVVWYFIVAIWIPIYVVIYWGPRIVETQ